MFKSKSLKSIIILLVFFVSLSLLILPSPAKAEDYDENLKWNTKECAEKCGAIAADMVSGLEKRKIECAKNYKKEICDNLDKNIAELRARFGVGTADDKGNIVPIPSDYCFKDHKKPSSNTAYCYAPPMAVDLQVPIGETKVALGLADYIIKFFEWGTRAIAIIAVFMIMWAGILWLSAAGNSSMLDQAKSKIQNAIVGLLLVLTSVFLLNLINPALTDLSGLEIKMVPTIAQGTAWCKDLSVPLGTKLIPADGSGDEIKFEKKGEDIGECGKRYKTKDGFTTCTGSGMCLSTEMCMPSAMGGFQCQTATISGKITGNKKVKEIRVYLKCVKSAYYRAVLFGDSKMFYKQGDILSDSSYYHFNNDIVEFDVETCEENKLGDSEVGYFLGYFLGILLEDKAWLSGDDWVAIDRRGKPFMLDGKNITPVKVSTDWTDNWKKLLLTELEIDKGIQDVDIDTSNIKTR